MHERIKELQILEDYGDGFCSRRIEWGRIDQRKSHLTEWRDK
jgi:hypothetical protein